MNSDYHEGYYAGWVACLAMIDKLYTRYLEQLGRQEAYLLEDGTLHGDAITSAYCDAEEACERYAYSLLQDWTYGRIPGDKPPTFPEDIIDATAQDAERMNYEVEMLLLSHKIG